MSNRLYKFIVIAQISLIALLLLFVLNGERVLEKIRNASPTSTNFSQDDSGEMVRVKSENKYL